MKLTELRQIHVGARFAVCRAQRSGTKVVVKTLRTDRRDVRSEARLKREFELLRTCVVPGVVQPLSLEELDGTAALILTDVGPVDLEEWLPSARLTVTSFLELATQMAATVAGVHRLNIIHRDLCPANFVLGESNRVTLVDFELGVIAGLARAGGAHDQLEASLPYLAPEQTGRMKRLVDHRADLYSLGATFYHMLTGTPPFTASDPLELVHAHLAQIPVFPTVVRPDLPAALAELVMKLLTKMPEWRYQTAEALLADLEEARKLWEASSTIAPFTLARLDRRELSVPAKLYGRERELAELEGALERSVAGSREVVVVQGLAGVGKTALIEELRPAVETRASPSEKNEPAGERGGLFLAGKCDQLRESSPFTVFAQAFAAIAREQRTASEAAAWQRRLRNSVAANGRVLTEIAPELSEFLGEQPLLAALGPVETENRAELTLVDFVRALAQPEHVLVLFLDDVQWMDPASLKLVVRLATDPDLSHLLVILAARSDEVKPEHPAARALQEIRRAGAHVVDIQLGPMDARALSALLGETLGTEAKRCRPLGELLRRKTAGNPLLAQRFLRLLSASDRLTFDVTAGAWSWDLARIASLPAPQDVVDLLTTSIQRLPDLVKQALTTAACIGTRFDVGMLEWLLEQSRDELARALWFAIREVLIVPTGETSSDGGAVYRFVHDRVQQAAYALVPEERRTALHLQIGRRLYARVSSGNVSDHIFEVVDQLNRGALHIQDEPTRLLLLDLNERASVKAKASAAYVAALMYLKRAIALLPADSWSSRYDVAFRLHRDAIELAFATDKCEAAEALSTTALSHTRSWLDEVTLHTVRMGGYTLVLDVSRAIRAGQEALRAFGLDLLEPEPQGAIAQASAALEQRLASRPIDSLLDAPITTSPEHVVLQRLLSELVPITYQSDPERHALIMSWGMRACLDHGHTLHSPSLYVTFAMQLVMRGQYERAHALGRLAIALAHKLGVREARTLSCFAFFINHWRAPFRSSVPVARAAVENGLEGGDLQYVAYSQIVSISAQLATGANLTSIATVLEDYLAFCRKIRSRTGIDALSGQSRLIQRLTASRRGGFTEAIPEQPMTQGMCANMRCWASYLLGDLDDALAMLEVAARQLPFFVSQVEHAEYVFHAALTLAAAADRAGADKRAALVARIPPLEAILGAWADNCPENFRHKCALVHAELEKLAGGRPDYFYLQAVEGAAREGFLQDEAVAQELAARYFLARGQRHLAGQHFAGALDSYSRWGATAKLALLQNELAQLELPALRRWVTPSPLAGDSAGLDLLTAFKAAETLSSEVMLEGLLEKMMRICVQTAGAQRSTLLVERDGQLHIDGRFDAERSTFEAKPPPGASVRDLVSEAIIWHTLQTGEEVVLGNAAESGAFTGDPYVIAHASKSILAMAARHRDRVQAVLFFENELSTDAFTRERLELLRLLLTQAAISLENARLYDSLRANEALLRDFFEGMPVGIYVLDARGRAAFANRRAVEIAGRALDLAIRAEDLPSSYQIYKAGTDDLYPISRLPVMRALQGDATVADDLEIRRPDRTVPVMAWGTPIRHEDGTVRYALVAFQDISEQRAMEASRAQLEARLYQAQRLESLGRLSGGVAHDFNNLLTPILIYADDALQELPPDSSIRENLAQIQGAAERAAKLVRQLLTFGGQQKLEMSDLDLNEELRTFEHVLRPLIRRDIELELRLDPELGKIRGDPAQLQRVFMNLGLNAVDAMPEGGRIILETQSIHRGPIAAVRIIDTGHGMDQETLTKIFDPFFTTKGPGKGTGLGLPSAHGILSQHGASFEVRSKPHEGTTFEILFPSIVGSSLPS